MAEADAGERGVGKAVLQAWSGTSELDIDLLPAPAATLRVRVVDGTRGSGRGPVAGMRVVARASLEAPASSQWPIRVERDATTDAKGIAEFRGLPAKHVSLAAADDEWEWEVERGGIRGVEEAPDQGTWEQEIEAFPRGRVAGVVLGPGGEPVAGARVEIPQNPDQRLAPAGAITGADGKFLIPFVTCQGPISVHATAPGYVPYDSDRITVVPGSTADGVVIALPAALGWIAGRVVDAAGNGRPEARVDVEPVDRRKGAVPIVAWTGTGGRFRVEVPAGQSWTLRATQSGLASEKSDPIAPGDFVPDLVLRPVEAGR
jgi:hypothetical protein